MSWEPEPDRVAAEPERPEALLKAWEVAEVLGVSPRVVLDRFNSGDLPGFRLWGGGRRGALRFRWSEIEAVLESWREGPPPNKDTIE